MVRLSRRTVMAGAAGALIAAPAVHAQPARTNMRMMLDWALQGPHSFAVLANAKGYFAQEGINATLDRGFGSARTPVEIANGTYQMGFADLPTAIQFAFRNPQIGLTAVAIIFDSSPLCMIADANGPIRVPKDVEGRRVAAPEADGGRQMFPAFARATNIDPARIEWMTVTPQLREPMLVRGEAQAITGFVTSAIMSLEAIGMPLARQRIFRYRDHGLPFYSGAILTTRRYIAENPAVVRGTVKALMRGVQDAIRNPDEGIAALRAVEQLTDVPIERRRLEIANQELIITENTRRNGLSFVDAARMQTNIDIVRDTFALQGSVSVGDIWEPGFLPPRAELALPTGTG